MDFETLLPKVISVRYYRRLLRPDGSGARNDNGFTILETVIAFSIIAIGLLGILTLVVQNVQVQYVNRNVLIASHLAQEGLELTRNVRDNNWLTVGSSWQQDLLSDGTYAIDYRGRSSIDATVNAISDDGARLYIDGNGFYSHAATVNATNLYRLITVVDQGSYLDVECRIRWRDRGQNYDYTARTYLYDWR